MAPCEPCKVDSRDIPLLRFDIDVIAFIIDNLSWVFGSSAGTRPSSMSLGGTMALERSIIVGDTTLAPTPLYSSRRRGVLSRSHSPPVKHLVNAIKRIRRRGWRVSQDRWVIFGEDRLGRCFVGRRGHLSKKARKILKGEKLEYRHVSLS